MSGPLPLSFTFLFPAWMTESSGLPPVSPKEACASDFSPTLRETVCEYINQFADEISNFMVGLAEDRGGLDSYMDYMRGPYGWGDDCTLSAMAHILCRPIHVVTTTRMASYVRQIEPPSTVASCNT